MVKNILSILFVLFTGYACYDYGYKTAYNRQAVILNKQIIDRENKIKELEQIHTLIQLEKENEIKSINSKYNSIISSLRNRPERTITIETSSPSTVCPRTSCTGEQLFREDAEFLIGEATKAETLKQSLTACRRYLIGS